MLLDSSLYSKSSYSGRHIVEIRRVQRNAIVAKIAAIVRDSYALCVVTWIAQSVRAKRIPLEYFLHRHRIDIALIVETHLKPDIKFYISNYSIDRYDRTCTRGGGVAIAVCHGIHHMLLPRCDTTIIESLGIQVSTCAGSVCFLVIYCP